MRGSFTATRVWHAPWRRRRRSGGEHPRVRRRWASAGSRAPGPSCACRRASPSARRRPLARGPAERAEHGLGAQRVEAPEPHRGRQQPARAPRSSSSTASPRAEARAPARARPRRPRGSRRSSPSRTRAAKRSHERIAGERGHERGQPAAAAARGAPRAGAVSLRAVRARSSSSCERSASARPRWACATATPSSGATDSRDRGLDELGELVLAGRRVAASQASSP